MQNSPAVPVSTVAPVSGSTILISTWGWTRPTVEVRWCSESPASVWVDTGEVSVMP